MMFNSSTGQNLKEDFITVEQVALLKQQGLSHQFFPGYFEFFSIHRPLIFISYPYD